MKEEEIKELIEKTIKEQKTQKVQSFGKSFNEVGSSEANLILCTKGDVKIKYGEKYIDLLKNGKINSDSTSVIEIDSEKSLGINKGIYKTKDGKIFIGNKQDHVALSENGSVLVYDQDQELSSDNLEQVFKNLNLVFETEEDVLNSNLKEGFVYIKDKQNIFIYKDSNITPVSQTQQTTSTDLTQVDKLAINTLSGLDSNIDIVSPVNMTDLFSNTAEIINLEVDNLKVTNLSYSNTETYLSKNEFFNEEIKEGDMFRDEDIYGLDISGKILKCSPDYIIVQNDYYILKANIIYYGENHDADIICTYCHQFTTNSSYNFNPDLLPESLEILNSNINLPYFKLIKDDEELNLYNSEDSDTPLKTITNFEVEGIIQNSTINLQNVDTSISVDLNNCNMYGDFIGDADVTSSEILDKLKENSLKDIYYINNSFVILNSIPRPSIVLTPSVDSSITDITVSFTIPSLQVEVDGKIGNTIPKDITISLADIFVNQSKYQWQQI